ncbi:hypothetical protein OH77DRAFT_1406291 [Trametes cingulata]|nr:hypothetical protein OH77DRAFT_1406291 [Trametes cingulata]
MAPPFVPVTASMNTDGWPGSPEQRGQEERAQQWRQDRYEERRLGPPRSSTPHSQSISLSSSPSSGSMGSLSRRPSMRVPTSEMTKRPPREWRSDFSMTGSGLLGSLLTRSRSKSFGGSAEFLHPRVTLHPYIRYNSSKPPMHYDLRRSANTLRFRALEHAISQWDLTRFACEPPVQHMRLFHAALPWYIDVEVNANPSGVTLYDLFLAIQNHMLSPIEYGDFYNNEMNNDVRDQIAIAWADRCRSEEERSRGVCKVDYLMGKYIMEGLQKGKDGLWEIKTRKPT